MRRKNIYCCFLILFFSLVMSNAAFSQDKKIDKQNETNILEKMNQRFSVDIPAEYSDILRGFVSNNITLKNEAAKEYTEHFIIKQMATDQGISKSNQYFFIWDQIYAVLTNSELYDGTDGNEKRYEEYESAFDFVLNCEKEYRENLEQIMRRELQKSREDLQQSREDLQQTRQDLQKSYEDLMEALADYYR